MPGNGTRHFACEATAILCIIELHIVDGPTDPAKLLRKMAHRGKEECNLSLMMLHIGGFGRHLAHQDDGRRGICNGEGGDVRRQLIPQDQHQLSHIIRPKAEPESQAHSTRGPISQSPQMPSLSASSQSAVFPAAPDRA